jgi:hypothetical protein
MITGILVVGIPLFFFNYLSDEILIQSRETAIEIEKEAILQEVANFKNRLTPEAYLKHIFDKIHKELLPTVDKNLFTLYPDKDFGNDLFNASLPEKFVLRLKEHELEPVLFFCNSSEFKDYWYWFSPELSKQCKNESDFLTLALCQKNMFLAINLYEISFQKAWKKYLEPNHPSQKILNMDQSANRYFYKYISRYSDPSTQIEKVFRVYTDYFSSQYLYGYNYFALSPNNIHGVYGLYVKQNSVTPHKLKEFACNSSQTIGTKCKIIKGTNSPKPGFCLEDNTLKFITPIPTKFYAHVTFWNKQVHSLQQKFPTNLFLVVSSQIQDHISGPEKLNKIIKFCSVIIISLFLMFSFYSFLFGLRLPINLHKKMLVALAILVLAPVSATGILSYYLYSGYERIIENQVIARIENRLSNFCYFEDEKRAILQNKALRIKAKLEKLSRIRFSQTDLEKLFPNIWRWITGISIVNENGEYFDFRELGFHESRVDQSLLYKYLINQGLSKIKGRKAQELELKTNLTMGLLESILTPEIEELISVHEGTLQRQITQTSNTFIGIILIIRNIVGANLLVYPRRIHNESIFYNYLAYWSLNKPEIFKYKDSLCEIDFGIRLRRHLKFSNLFYPRDMNKKLEPVFRDAIKIKNSGNRIIRDGNELKFLAWRYREYHQMVVAALGTSSRLNFVRLIIYLTQLSHMILTFDSFCKANKS